MWKYCIEGLLRPSKHYLPISAVSCLCNSTVKPYFLYCCSVWDCCSATEIQHLQRLQNRAARIVTNDATIKPILEKLGWKTIQQLICIQTKVTTFKSLTNLAPEYLSNLFNKDSACTSRNLRNSNTDVRLPKMNTM